MMDRTDWEALYIGHAKGTKGHHGVSSGNKIRARTCLELVMSQAFLNIGVYIT